MSYIMAALQTIGMSYLLLEYGETPTGLNIFQLLIGNTIVYKLMDVERIIKGDR